MTGPSVAPEPGGTAALLAPCDDCTGDGGRGHTLRGACMGAPCEVCGTARYLHHPDERCWQQKVGAEPDPAAAVAPPRPTSALSVLDAVAHVEALAQTLYDDAMGRDWPMPYSSLTVSDQERWRGAAYCATYALAICPITRSVHPWLRSWCEPSCRTAASAQAEARQSQDTAQANAGSREPTNPQLPHTHEPPQPATTTPLEAHT